MPTDHSAPLKCGAIERVLDTDHVTEATRKALQDRLAWTPPAAPQCFDAEGFATLEAICERVIPQPDVDRQVALAARLDDQLVNGLGHGWRYDVLPPNKVAIPQGVKGVEETAKALFGKGFTALAGSDQDKVLATVQEGSSPGGIWKALDSKRWFEEMLAALAELYYAHPYAQERIGYIGMADAQGFHTLGLNVRDPIENEASDAAL